MANAPSLRTRGGRQRRRELSIPDSWIEAAELDVYAYEDDSLLVNGFRTSHHRASAHGRIEAERAENGAVIEWAE